MPWFKFKFLVSVVNKNLYQVDQNFVSAIFEPTRLDLIKMICVIGVLRAKNPDPPQVVAQ